MILNILVVYTKLRFTQVEYKYKEGLGFIRIFLKKLADIDSYLLIYLGLPAGVSWKCNAIF